MSVQKKRTVIEPFKIKMIEPLAFKNRKEREQILKNAGYNLFQIAAEDVTFDLLTDSGTTAMSAAQWAAMATADESYAGSRSYYRFKNQVEAMFGYSHVIPVHQGRACERLLFSQLLKPGMKVPSNNHFDTTRANIEEMKCEAIDLVIDEGRNPSSTFGFKGNINIEKLERFCVENKGKIPFGMMTITNNNCGGQPVSLANLEAASKVFKKHSIPFILDACRFSENSYFIKEREKGCEKLSVKEIVRKTADLADGLMMSGKKDALANIGGFIALRTDEWGELLRNQLILTEGFPTYGGLAARDLETMTVGLEEVMDENYLEYRIAVANYLADGLNRMGIPTVQPTGAHAVFIDARKFLDHIPASENPGQALVCEMYLHDGVRVCEIKAEETPLVRMAIPRRVYTQSHFDFILEGMQEIVSRKKEIRGMKLVYDPPGSRLKQFSSKFEPI